jgi:hypothetical protein
MVDATNAVVVLKSSVHREHFSHDDLLGVNNLVGVGFAEK